MAPACGRHNRAVGSEPHQWSTEKITDGPDRGRYGWRRNADPPERLRANHEHRIDELLQQHSASDDPCADPPDIEEPPTVLGIEHRLACIAVERLPRAPEFAQRFDISWPQNMVIDAA
ncbi:MAG: hypothetical protein NTW76_04855 [Corynebacteriales bacterium]|nr:hypothetical protein [Mycobacteriales bacterium]